MKGVIFSFVTYSSKKAGRFRGTCRQRNFRLSLVHGVTAQKTLLFKITKLTTPSTTMYTESSDEVSLTLPPCNRGVAILDFQSEYLE
jgi:hypothetical protein